MGDDVTCRVDVRVIAGTYWDLGLSIVLLAAARLSLVRDDYQRARSQASEALLLSQQLEDPRGIAWGFAVFAGVLAAEGQMDHAVRLWGVSDRLLEGLGGALSPEISWIRDQYRRPVERSLGSEESAAACDEGRGMALDHALALALGRAASLPREK